eukprot:4955053-Pyramimonas_sp.AAC.1
MEEAGSAVGDQPPRPDHRGWPHRAAQEDGQGQVRRMGLGVRGGRVVPRAVVHDYTGCAAIPPPMHLSWANERSGLVSHREGVWFWWRQGLQAVKLSPLSRAVGGPWVKLSPLSRALGT